MSLTTNPNDPCLKEGKSQVGQNECYLILSEEERAKGFVRPVRRSYIHVGKNVASHWKSIHRMLDETDEQYPKCVAVMTILTKEDGSFLGGPYVTQEELDAWKKNKLVGGCGVETTMGLALCETYARDPKFYGSTFCGGCQTHLPIEEFVWAEDNQVVGS